MHDITSIEALRALYAETHDIAVKKQMPRLDRHSKRFIELSPFLVLATASAGGTMDASPRGGAPGFVKTPDDTTLLIPDAPGNNRLDSLQNVVATGRVGLLFLIPGFDETLRVNGSATLSTDPGLVALCTNERRAPKVVIRIGVEEAYLHCAKAFMRSKLWRPESHVPRDTMPTIGRMIAEQAQIELPDISQEEMVRRYAADL